VPARRAVIMRGHLVTLGLGANLGRRVEALERALRQLRQLGTVERTSLLYDTAPEYVTEQPRFLNAACQLRTALPPLELLGAVKDIERRAGRDLDADGAPAPGSLRFGPRALDIDLLFCGGDGEAVVMDTEKLTLPHPRVAERGFVLRPLADMDPAMLHPSLGLTVGQLLQQLEGTRAGREQLCGLQAVGPLRQVVEVASGGGSCDSEASRADPPLFRWGERTHMMGVVTMTPDSFSDGGSFGADSASAVAHGLRMVGAGVDVLDIGGHSTRPGFEPVSEQEETQRVIGVIRGLRESCSTNGDTLAGLAAGAGLTHGTAGRHVALSVDTFRPAVAAAAVAAGADIINDVSGGMYSNGEMYHVAAELCVPLVLMDHGTDPVSLHAPHPDPTADHKITDAAAESSDRGGGGGHAAEPPPIVSSVADALMRMVGAAEQAGMARWQLFIDPGLGFAKDSADNLALLRHLPQLKQAVGGLPLVLGASRKRFTGAATWHARQEQTPPPFAERDWATAGVCAAAVASGAVDIVRVHNDRIGDAIRAADMIHRK
jgi:2-amino-4-hydroxy-6-hydroxymethyldihydropteridine diphosphokinase